MNTNDLAQYLGYLIVCWSLGFSGGYVLTNFKRGLEQAA